MKKIFIIFLFIIFSSSFSLAKNNEKITVEEVEDIFLNKKEYLSQFIEQWTAYSPLSKDVPENAVIRFKSKDERNIYYRKLRSIDTARQEERKNPKKRAQTRGVAKCMNNLENRNIHLESWSSEDIRSCLAKVIRAVLSRSEKTEKRKPGSIFYALFAIKGLVYNWENRKKYLDDAMMTSIAGISAAMKNTG
jgi:hypothetical protein